MVILSLPGSDTEHSAYIMMPALSADGAAPRILDNGQIFYSCVFFFA